MLLVPVAIRFTLLPIQTVGEFGNKLISGKGLTVMVLVCVPLLQPRLPPTTEYTEVSVGLAMVEGPVYVLKPGVPGPQL